MKLNAKVKTIVSHWIEYYKENPKLFFLEAAATCTEVIAAITLSTQATNPPMLFVFCLYSFGASCLMYTTFKRKIFWMTGLMLFYLCNSMYGIINLLT